MTEKTSKIVIASATMFVVCAILFLVVGLIHDCCQPKHKVYVEYTIYRNGVEYNKSGTYDVRGKEFEVVVRTDRSSNRYGSGYGPNLLLILDKKYWLGYFGLQCVCVYSGYNDVECNYFEVVE